MASDPIGRVARRRRKPGPRSNLRSRRVQIEKHFVTPNPIARTRPCFHVSTGIRAHPLMSRFARKAGARSRRLTLPFTIRTKPFRTRALRRTGSAPAGAGGPQGGGSEQGRCREDRIEDPYLGVPLQDTDDGEDGQDQTDHRKECDLRVEGNQRVLTIGSRILISSLYPSGAICCWALRAVGDRQWNQGLGRRSISA
jgi:hypothetical protein